MLITICFVIVILINIYYIISIKYNFFRVYKDIRDFAEVNVKMVACMVELHERIQKLEDKNGISKDK
jgi:hypothetical protein